VFGPLFNYEHCGSSDMGTGGGDDDDGKVKREEPKAEAAGAAAAANGEKGEGSFVMTAELAHSTVCT
jgi:hypothetical protein